MTGGVATYLGGRLLGAIPMLFLMSLVVFAIVYLIPGDPIDAMLGHDGEQSAREALRTELGLDQPLWRQYLSWLAQVAQGDLGRAVPPDLAGGDARLRDGRLADAPGAGVAIAPGVATSLAVLGWNLLGDGLRDALDPRLTE